MNPRDLSAKAGIELSELNAPDTIFAVTVGILNGRSDDEAKALLSSVTILLAGIMAKKEQGNDSALKYNPVKKLIEDINLDTLEHLKQPSSRDMIESISALFIDN